MSGLRAWELLVDDKKLMQVEVHHQYTHVSLYDVLGLMATATPGDVLIRADATVTLRMVKA